MKTNNGQAQIYPQLQSQEQQQAQAQAQAQAQELEQERLDQQQQQQQQQQQNEHFDLQQLIQIQDHQKQQDGNQNNCHHLQQNHNVTANNLMIDRHKHTHKHNQNHNHNHNHIHNKHNGRLNMKKRNNTNHNNKNSMQTRNSFQNQYSKFKTMQKLNKNHKNINTSQEKRCRCQAFIVLMVFTVFVGINYYIYQSKISNNHNQIQQYRQETKNFNQSNASPASSTTPFSNKPSPLPSPSSSSPSTRSVPSALPVWPSAPKNPQSRLSSSQGQASKQSSQLNIWTISVQSQSQNQNENKNMLNNSATMQKQSQFCVLFVVNCYDGIYLDAIGNVQRVFQQRGKYLRHFRIIIFGNIHNYQNDYQQIKALQYQFNKNSIKIYVTFKNVTKIDSNYNFINSQTYLNDSKGNEMRCNRVVYLQSNMILSSKAISNIIQASKQLTNNQISYSRNSIPIHNRSQLQLHLQLQPKSSSPSNASQFRPLLPKIPLPLSPQFPYSKYLYIFPTYLLDIVTPFNFAYMTRYTLEEIFILPILSLFGSGMGGKGDQGRQGQGVVECTELVQFATWAKLESKVVFKIDEPDYEQYRSGQSKQDIKNNKAYNYSGWPFCFVGYSTTPTQLNISQTLTYLKSLIPSLLPQTPTKIILYIPYNTSQSLSPILTLLSQILQNNLNIIAKLRFVYPKVTAAHVVYQAAYLFCPRKSVFVSSRFNVEVGGDFVREVGGAVGEKYHHYFANYQLIDSNKPNGNNSQVVFFDKVPTYSQRYFVRKGNIFDTHFSYLQISKTQLIRTCTFWVLKCSQLQFYQTQQALFFLLAESIRLQVSIINKTLYRAHVRPRTPTQLSQSIILKKYAQYSQIPNNKLQPYPLNSLQNPAFAYNAPAHIPKKIHQFWLSRTPISPIRLHLHKTLQQANPSFSLHLWQSNNLTPVSFPLTYPSITKILQYDKYASRSYLALAADLFRYEILYQYGGIYVDFKMEGQKDMSNFLKYEEFYLDGGNGNERWDGIGAFGIGVMGAMEGNYHIGVLLNQILELDNINFKQQSIPKVSGGFLLRKSYTLTETLTEIGLGYHLLFPKPYDNPVNECGTTDPNRQFSLDQTVYTVEDYISRSKIRIGIPCREYPQSYVINYTPLARTWRGNKRNVG